jgi:NAD(P)-dependent dehydrogenase (short-subunit alcohol dehydrogenase family)
VTTTGRLAGKIAIITGEAQGLGRAPARRFATEGAIVAEADVADCAAGDLADELGGHYLRTNVRDPGMVRTLVEATVPRHRRLDAQARPALWG